jgi:hypothetical protein
MDGENTAESNDDVIYSKFNVKQLDEGDYMKTSSRYWALLSKQELEYVEIVLKKLEAETAHLVEE